MALFDARSGHNPRNRHVLDHIRAVDAIVAAVVSLHKYMRRGRQRGQHSRQAAVYAFSLAQVAVADPAIVVTGGVHRAQIDEREVGLQVGQVGEHGVDKQVVTVGLVNAVAIPCKVENLGAAEVAQRLPIVEEGAAPGVRLGLLNQPWQRTRHGVIGVGGDAVARRRHAVKDRHVTGKCHGGHGGLGDERRCTARNQPLERGQRGVCACVRAQAVNHHKDHGVPTHVDFVLRCGESLE